MEASTSSLTDRTPTGSQTQVITSDQLPDQVRITKNKTSFFPVTVFLKK